MQTKTHTHTHTRWLKKHSYTQPQALDIPPVHPLKCLHWELRCASSITTGALTGEEPRHVTSDTPAAAESSSKLRGSEKFGVSVEWKTSVGVIVGVKAGLGTWQSTIGCVVIQIQGNIWELVHGGAHLSHSLVSSDIWARRLLHGIVLIPQIYLRSSLCLHCKTEKSPL